MFTIQYFTIILTFIYFAKFKIRIYLLGIIILNKLISYQITLKIMIQNKLFQIVYLLFQF